MQNKSYNLYPELPEKDFFTLKTGTIHDVYYEMCGNPKGAPVVFLHGGPGSGCNPTQRRFFDPAHYCIILIDQRGCGRSLPQGETLNNTTDDLLQDIDAIREALGFTSWLVFGGSWGSTLALGYALKFTERVNGLILRGIFLSRPQELNWFLGDITHFYPDAWQALIDYLPKEAQQNVLQAYHDLVFSDDAKVSVPAAAQWNAYENAIMRLIPADTSHTSTQKSNNNNQDSVYQKPLTTPSLTLEQGLTEVARARVQIHYIVHDCFVDGEAMLASCHTLAHIPTVIVQGRYDMVCPPKSAWDLKQVMPHAEFYMIQDAGHSAMETGITSALVRATEDFKSKV